MRLLSLLFGLFGLSPVAPLAVGQQHWAYRAPERAPLPEVERAEWIRQPLDRFVLAHLEERGATPSPAADRATLARRVSLDLTGLPPRSADLEAFLADSEEGAYERFVDRLLASPHYGERWAQHWLDLARYADSHGFTFDDRREMWPYRDWVVDAFNSDMPFDRFTVEQLAGDLLPEPTEAQLIATGFHRNTMTNQEGGADDEEFRVVAVKDRVDTTATVWLGTTLACAQCHDHKYDPFTLRDYYGFYAFFDQTQDTGTRVEPLLDIYRPEELAELERIEAEIAELERALTSDTPELAEEQAAWEEERRDGNVEWSTLRPTTTRGATLRIQQDGSVRLADKHVDKATYDILAPTEERGVTALLLEVFEDAESPQRGPGNADNGNFVLTELDVTVAPRANPRFENPVELIEPRASFHQHRSHASYYPIEAAIDGDPRTGWAILPRVGETHRAVFLFSEPVGFEGGSIFRVRLAQDYGHRHVIGRLRLRVTTAPPPIGPLSVERTDIAAILDVPAERRTDEQRERIAAHYRSIAPRLDPARERLAQLERAGPRPTSALVMREVDTPRVSRVMKRGSFLSPGPVIEPAVPEVLPALDSFVEGAAGVPTRLDLARWLVHPRHPLTARVTVNRWWQRFFGTGLVETENDFGTRSPAPSHPDLLDWLAVELVESGFRPKAMHRAIVLSATYRQATRARPELAESDPRNRTLARQNRLRLDAEAIRDSALVASGLLHAALGGPPVHPPQPDGVYQFTQKVKDWPTDAGANRYRRTLYTRLWRTSPHPFRTTFDAPDPAFACTRRYRSNTPLQALTLANDPMALEWARGLAQRALEASFEDDDERLRAMFRWTLGREPESAELALLAEFLEAQRRAYDADPRLAAELTPGIGEPREPGTEAGTARSAAWTATARVLFNLDEFVTRG